MSALSALSVAVELAERKRDEARRGLQDARRSQQAALDQMEQLKGYAQETQNRWGMRANASVQPEVMYHHYQFMDRLQHAMTLQTTVVASHDERVTAAQQGLLATELRLASLKKLAEKRRKEFELLQSRRDQKQTDERAALQYRSTSNGPDGREH
jgi:flagellar FliJ protein